MEIENIERLCYVSYKTLKQEYIDIKSKDIFPEYVLGNLKKYIIEIYDDFLCNRQDNGFLIVKRKLYDLILTDEEWENCKRYFEDEGFNVLQKTEEIKISWQD